jgi:beta-galactosidase
MTEKTSRRDFMKVITAASLTPSFAGSTAQDFAEENSTADSKQAEIEGASSQFFPVAVWYAGGKARAPMLEPVGPASSEEWGKDLDAIKATGFNTVKCWVDWATAEPKPNTFDFQHMELLMKLAGQRGLRVIVQIYMDSAPDWVGAQFPDSRFVDRSGSVIDSQAAPGYCIDSPAVRAEVVKFTEALSRDANRFAALYGWDVWSEPHVVNWARITYLPHAEFCFCPYTQQRFRQWLRRKYKNPAALNAAWYRGFRNWDEVTPPRFSTILSYTDYLDWRAFITDKLAFDLKTYVDAVRAADHVHPITSHAADPALFTSPMNGYGEPDDWKMAAVADFFGTSIYPKHAGSIHPMTEWELGASLDFERSAGHSFKKGFWIGELQGGQNTNGMRIVAPVTAHDEQYWMWEVVGTGATEIAIYAWYPMNAGYQSGADGLINLDGTLTDRARAAGVVAQVIARNASGINQSVPAPAEIAILYDRLSYMVGGTEPSRSTLGDAERDSLMGIYRAFFEKQIPVDFVNPAAMEQNSLNQYKVLFIPYPVMLSSRVAEEIKQYISQGGTAVAEARLAWNDARGFTSPAIPGHGLDQVFGAREKLITPEAEPRLVIQPSAGLIGLKEGDSIPVQIFKEDLQPLGNARVLARFQDGEPAMVANKYGHGIAILIGSFVGLAYQRQHAVATQELIVSLGRLAGIRPEVRISGPGTSQIEVRRRVSDHEQFVIVFNHASGEARATIALRLPWRVRSADDLMENRNVPIRTQDGETFLERNLVAGEIWVVHLAGL